MVSEELALIERIGIGATAFVLTYLLLKRTQEKAFAQADKVLDMAETTIKENTVALERMFEALTAHTIQKERIIEEMKDCRRAREEQISKLQSSIKR